MKCSHCNLFFNSGDKLPILLPECGHNICLSCVNPLLINSSIICPLCKKVTSNISSINTLPKNLVLLTVSNDTSNSYTCPIHGKRFEAFCENDRALLCIDCILLGGHKSHEICTIPIASERERNYVNTNIEISKNHIETLQSLIMNVNDTKLNWNWKSKKDSWKYKKILKTLLIL